MLNGLHKDGKVRWWSRYWPFHCHLPFAAYSYAILSRIVLFMVCWLQRIMPLCAPHETAEESHSVTAAISKESALNSPAPISLGKKARGLISVALPPPMPRSHVMAQFTVLALDQSSPAMEPRFPADIVSTNVIEFTL